MAAEGGGGLGRDNRIMATGAAATATATDVD